MLPGVIGPDPVVTCNLLEWPAVYSLCVFAFLARGRFLPFGSHEDSSLVSGGLGQANPLFPLSL